MLCFIYKSLSKGYFPYFDGLIFISKFFKQWLIVLKFLLAHFLSFGFLTRLSFIDLMFKYILMLKINFLNIVLLVLFMMLIAIQILVPNICLSSIQLLFLLLSQSVKVLIIYIIYFLTSFPPSTNSKILSSLISIS